MRKSAAPGWVPLEEAVPADVFKSEVLAWARRIGVEPKEIHIRPMKQKVGQLFSVGQINF